MPRNNRRTALVLALALLVGLAGQAAAALPLGPRSAASETSTGDFLAAVWAWLTAQWSGLGHAAVSTSHPVTGAWEKDGSHTDPNGHPANCIRLGPP
jgi:hypothetical protein